MMDASTIGHVYLVSIYNKIVRAMVKENKSHNFFADKWADIHTQGVIAKNEREARKKMTNRYPPEEGFVIESVVPVMS